MPNPITQLYAFQDQVLRLIQSLETGFYLTGGTALSRGYLNHRYSEDLDFFVNDDENFLLWSERIIQALSSARFERVEVISRSSRYINLVVREKDLSLKIELVNDVPSRVGSVATHPALGRIDSLGNILANKVSALVSRDEPKDLADIWALCCVKSLSLSEAIRGAQSKAAGLFPADIARRLLLASESDWNAILWIDAPDVSVFLDQLHTLGEELLLS